MRAVVFLAAIYAYGLVALFVNRSIADQPFSVGFAVRETTRALVGLTLTGSPHLGGPFGKLFPVSVLLLGLAAVAVTVPAWLARAVESSRDGASTGIPKGGKASLDRFLSELEGKARPDQLAAIEQFKTDFGASIVDGGFMRQNVADGVLTFLSSQAKPPEGGEGTRPAPRPAPKGQGSAADGSLGPSSAKPLTKAEIAANRREAASLLDDMLPQIAGDPESLMHFIKGQFLRAVDVVRMRHIKGLSGENIRCKGSRIVRSDLRSPIRVGGRRQGVVLHARRRDGNAHRVAHDVVRCAVTRRDDRLCVFYSGDAFGSVEWNEPLAPAFAARLNA